MLQGQKEEKKRETICSLDPTPTKNLIFPDFTSRGEGQSRSRSSTKSESATKIENGAWQPGWLTPGPPFGAAGGRKGMLSQCSNPAVGPEKAYTPDPYTPFLGLSSFPPSEIRLWHCNLPIYNQCGFGARIHLSQPRFSPTAKWAQ